MLSEKLELLTIKEKCEADKWTFRTHFQGGLEIKDTAEKMMKYA